MQPPKANRNLNPVEPSVCSGCESGSGCVKVVVVVVVVMVVVVMVATVVVLVVVVMVAVDAHRQSHERKLITRGCGCRDVQVVVAVVTACLFLFWVSGLRPNGGVLAPGT